MSCIIGLVGGLLGRGGQRGEGGSVRGGAGLGWQAFYGGGGGDAVAVISLPYCLARRLQAPTYMEYLCYNCEVKISKEKKGISFFPQTLHMQQPLQPK